MVEVFEVVLVAVVEVESTRVLVTEVIKVDRVDETEDVETTLVLVTEVINVDFEVDAELEEIGADPTASP